MTSAPAIGGTLQAFHELLELEEGTIMTKQKRLANRESNRASGTFEFATSTYALLVALTAAAPACSSAPESHPNTNAEIAGAASTGGSSNAAGATSTGGSAATGGSSHTDSVLGDLGVDTSIGARVDPTGQTVPTTYNPTLRPVSLLGKRSEVFVGGVGCESGKWPASGKHHALLDWADGASDFNPTSLTGGDDGWLTLPKAMATGDLNGDAIDEIVVAFFTPTTADKTGDLKFEIVQRNKSTGTYSASPQHTLITGVTLTEYPDANWWQQNFGATTLDLDGNGQSETAIAFNGGVYVIGDADKDYGLVKTLTYNKGYTGYKLLRLAAGDVNNDGRDELVVSEGSIQSANQALGTATYHIYQGILLAEVASDTLSVTAGTDTQTLRGANCAVGDIDGDGLNEILFLGPSTGTDYYAVIVKPTWDEKTSKFKYVIVPRIDKVAQGRDVAFHSPLCAIADFDGDGKKDILAQRYIYRNLRTIKDTFTKMTAGNVAIDLYNSCGVKDYGANYENSLAVGDIDGDLKSDVAFVSDRGDDLCVMGYGTAGTWGRKGTGNITSLTGYPYVTMGDYDGDSIAVEYQTSELLFTDPHPIAVLAANPSWSDTDMSGSTSFGTTTSTTNTEGSTIGFKVGVSFGYEAEGLFDLYDFSVKTSFESAFDWTATKSTTIEESYNYTTNDKDLVVFTTVPYDVYYYKVIQAPDTKMLGTTITVNLPRKPVTLPVERSFYNAHNGNAPDVDSTILSHTIGNPLSYPSKEDASVLIASNGGEGLISSKTMTVGEGPGSTSIEMSKTTDSEVGRNFDFAVSVEAEAGAGGFKAGVSAGFHYGENYSVSTGDGTTFSGEVGNIPEADYSNDKSFSWGLFTYRGKVGSDKFIVVQYYTEAAR